MDRAVPFARIVPARDAPLRLPADLHRGRQGRLRGRHRRRARRATSSSPSGPTSSRRRSGWRRPSSGPSSTPGTSPTATPSKYRRLHVIVGDANLSEVATFLKVGTTALVLAMIEDDWFERQRAHLALRAPVPAMRQVSYDLTLGSPIELADGRSMTALEMQWEHLDLARKYAEDRGLDAVGGAEIGGDDPAPVGAGPDRARGRPHDAWPASSTGWPSTGSSTGTGSATGWSGTDPKLAAMDLQYHDVRPARSLHARLGMETPARPGSGRAGRHRAARDHPGLLPGQVPAAVGLVRSPRPTGTRSCSTSAATRCAGSR